MTQVLCIFGSPRRGGNTDRLLGAFIEGAEQSGAHCERVWVSEEAFMPCQGCQRCETEGRCVVEDGMQRIYPGIEQADLIVIASPVYFYGFPAQTKALIDRGQLFWARKHRLGLRRTDPKAGFLISAGGTKGERLFRCVELTMKAYCEALDARYLGSLTFRSLDRPGDIEGHPEYLDEARDAGRRVVADLANDRRPCSPA